MLLPIKNNKQDQKAGLWLAIRTRGHDASCAGVIVRLSSESVLRLVDRAGMIGLELMPHESPWQVDSQIRQADRCMYAWTDCFPVPSFQFEGYLVQ